MTSILLAAVVILTILVLLDLSLTLAVIKRLRAMAQSASRSRAAAIGGPTVGSEAPALELHTIGGTVLNTAEVTRDAALVAFLTDGCKPCHEQLPELRSIVQSRVADGERALIVVLASDRGAEEFAEAFDGLAPVVLDGEDIPIAEAFGVDGYPTYVEFADGVTRDVHDLVADLRRPVRV